MLPRFAYFPVMMLSIADATLAVFDAARLYAFRFRRCYALLLLMRLSCRLSPRHAFDFHGCRFRHAATPRRCYAMMRRDATPVSLRHFAAMPRYFVIFRFAATLALFSRFAAASMLLYRRDDLHVAYFPEFLRFDYASLSRHTPSFDFFDFSL